MKRNDLKQLLAIATVATANAEGFTVQAQTLQPITTGYAVAVKDTQNSFGFAGMVEVYKYIQQHPEINAVGGWYNSENGKFYFDATIVCQDLNTALELGRMNEQIAIFDLNTLTEIRL
jgi:fructokinase